ncbi:MAG: Long-chain-fatty-acid--CoA ligase [Alphaproteobacteria bacterium]|jgi:3-oxoacyl-[acyl-carrier-protein] synthase-3|nr:Long-chain-fatty-acid--CoA ligase [Alphaproteobacteria bacterium]
MAKASEAVMRGLMIAWADFDSSLDTVPVIDKIRRGKFRVEDYKSLLINHRQQVVEGARWIARAASSIDGDWLEQRSLFLKHAVTEHQDFRMLENHYVSVGGKLEDIRTAKKNIGTEALHAFMYHSASQTNPFDLLGAMFMIEGLGQRKAGVWGKKIKDQLELEDKQVSFFLYHAENDDGHMEKFQETLDCGILELAGMGERIVKTARVVARLYRLQLEEIGNT